MFPTTTSTTSPVTSGSITSPVTTSPGLNLGAALASGGLTVDSVPAPTPSVPQSYGNPGTPASTPKNFVVQDTGSTVPSSSLAPNSVQNLLATRNEMQSNMTGNNPLIPSDSLQSQYANNVYQSSLYSPAEKQLISNQADLAQQIDFATLNAKRQVADLQQSGAITQDQAKSQIQDINDRANARLADLNYNNSQDTAQLTALGLIRQNQVAANTALLGAAKPTEVSPGSTLVQPLNGQPVYQGGGAAPAAVASYALQLENSSIQQGTAQYAPDGSINHSYYYQLAQSQLGGVPGAGTSFGQPSSSFSPAALNPSSPNFVQSLPNAVAPAYRQMSDGKSYFDGSQLDAAGLGTARAIQKQTGIPILTKEDVNTLQDLQSVVNGLNTTKIYFNQLAPDGILGKITGTVTNPFSKLLSTDYGSVLKAYQDNRDNLFRQISTFAGSHPRLNTTEILTQAAALPKIGNNPFTIDSLKDGVAKMDLLQQSISNIENSLVPQNGQYNIPNTPTPNTGQGISNNVIQTKVGAIDNSWFQ